MRIENGIAIDKLQKKVEERTRELGRANEALGSEIAERKLAEKAVKQAEDRLRLIIDTIPTMAWSLRPDGVLDFLNQRWLDYTGLSLQEAIEEPTRTVHPEDLSRVMEKWLVVKTTSEVYEDEMRLRRADGEYRWFLVRIAPLLDEQGNLLKRYGVSIDIEDRKQAEEALRKSEKLFAMFMDRLPGFAWIKDIEGRYVYVNKKESELDAYRAGAIGKTDAELWPAEIASAYQANDRQVITTRKAVQTVEPSLADGEQSYMLVTKFPIFDQDGSVVMVAGAGVDITDRIQAEQALRESETRFRQVAENISEVFWLANPEATLIHYVSPAYEKIWGRACDSLYAEPSSWMDSIHPDDRDRIAEGVRLQLVHGRHDHIYRIVRPDGSLRWIRDRAFPVRDEAGKLIRVAGIAEDITERKEAEEKLRRSEEKFKVLFGIAPVGISVLDGQHNVVDANPALEQITRLSKEELLNGAYRRRTYLHADGTPRPPKEMASARAITEKRPLNAVETGIVTENGEIIWTQVSVAPLALPDASAVVITQDITERKQAEQALRESEERFRQLTENIDEVFWLSDLRHTAIFYVSPAYERLWGLSCDSLYASPRSWTEAIHPEDKERVVRILADRELQIAPDMVYRIIRPDGSTRWVHARGFPVHDGNGAVVRVAGIAEDITERRRAQEESRSFSRQLLQVQEIERRHLARELHDQIGQSLTAAKINVEVLRAATSPELLGRLDETAAILDRLLGQVRQISLDLRPSMLDDLGLVPALRSLLDQEGRRASVAVRFTAESVPESLDQEIQTTCFRIAQEAITNALRHAHATQLDVDLRCAGGKLRLLIRDNGVGFDVVSVQAQAAGLGLIGIKERAALIGGRAKIISSPGKGTTIKVSLPIALRRERAGRP